MLQKLKTLTKWMILAMASSTITSAGASQTQGMLLLHSKNQTAALNETIPQLGNRGCSLWHWGSVVETLGNLDIGSPDRFILLACDAQILDTAENRRALTPMLKNGAVAVEGPIMFRSDKEGEIGERAYIFKISHYTNSDPDGRDNDLDSLNSFAADRADHWTYEAFYTGLYAAGMATPDEVVVMHYDNPQQGERFRNNNPDIMKQIEAFNQNHLTEFTYIAVSLD